MVECVIGEDQKQHRRVASRICATLFFSTFHLLLSSSSTLLLSSILLPSTHLPPPTFNSTIQGLSSPLNYAPSWLKTPPSLLPRSLRSPSYLPPRTLPTRHLSLRLPPPTTSQPVRTSRSYSSRWTGASTRICAPKLQPPYPQTTTADQIALYRKRQRDQRKEGLRT